MRLTVVGCAGSLPGTAGPASCYLVEAPGDDAGTRVLLDLGSGALGPLQRLVDLAHLDAVLLSHLHPDHCLDLCGLYVYRRYHPTAPATTPMPVHGPAGTVARLVAAYGSDGGSGGGIATTYEVREWDDGARARIGGIDVVARRIRHSVEGFGIRLEHGGRTMAYTGDTDTCPGLDALAEGVDLLLAEASFVEGRDAARGIHLTGRRAGEVAARAGVGRLVLTHLPPWTDPAVVLAEARSAYSGPVDVATPGARFPV